MDFYRRALELNPNQAEILLGLSDTIAALGRYQEAAMQLQELVSLRPDSPGAHTALSRFLAAQGRKHEAEKHCMEALRLL